MTSVVITAVVLFLCPATAGAISRLGVFYSKQKIHVPFDTVVKITEENVLQCVAKCFRNKKCNAVVQHYGSNSICSLLMVENEDNITLNQTLMDFDPDSVIWIRSENRSTQNPEAELNMLVTEEGTASATTASATAASATTVSATTAATTTASATTTATTTASATTVTILGHLIGHDALPSEV